PSALLGRDPILRNFRALLLALITGLPACLTIFTHIDSPAITSGLTHTDFWGRRIKRAGFPARRFPHCASPYGAGRRKTPNFVGCRICPFKLVGIRDHHCPPTTCKTESARV